MDENKERLLRLLKYLTECVEKGEIDALDAFFAGARDGERRFGTASDLSGISNELQAQLIFEAHLRAAARFLSLYKTPANLSLQTDNAVPWYVAPKKEETP